MNVYFVRHGQTDWNFKGMLQGSSDIPLNEEGIRQAYETKALLKDIKIDKLYCSPLSRAKATAEIINELYHLPMHMDERLIERGFGILEGQHVPKEQFEEFWDYSDVPPFERAETTIAFFKRIYDVMDDIAKDAGDQTILIVAHGAVSIPFQLYFDGFDPNSKFTSYLLKNCEISHKVGTKYFNINES